MVRVGLVAVLCACQYNPPTSTPRDAPGDPDTPVDMPIDMPAADFWQAVIGASAASNPNSLVSTATTGWGNAGATSVRSIASGDCYVEFRSFETNTGKALGLSVGDSNQSYVDIQFAILLGANRRFSAYENGTQVGPAGNFYDVNSTFRVELMAGTVRYLHNGFPFHTSVVAPSYPLIVDAALFTQGATLTNVELVDLP